MREVYGVLVCPSEYRLPPDKLREPVRRWRRCLDDQLQLYAHGKGGMKVVF